ncbi:hypothetical protein PR048_006052 [Dryococelus australis]|uniref:Uncharacterized protein n=1 Tax=Dryococelus australis TaxID=614101 RepID=A0ABQ9IAY9_9NEOP|nr:hypothetical protein PR048_006052 [Dryococelus australis]
MVGVTDDPGQFRHLSGIGKEDILTPSSAWMDALQRRLIRTNSINEIMEDWNERMGHFGHGLSYSCFATTSENVAKPCVNHEDDRIISSFASVSDDVSKNASTTATITVGATVTELLVLSPPTKANLVQSPAGAPNFRKWESCRTMPLVGGYFSENLPFPTRFHFGAAPCSLQSPSLFASALSDAQGLASRGKVISGWMSAKTIIKFHGACNGVPSRVQVIRSLRGSTLPRAPPPLGFTVSTGSQLGMLFHSWLHWRKPLESAALLLAPRTGNVDSTVRYFTPTYRNSGGNSDYQTKKPSSGAVGNYDTAKAHLLSVMVHHGRRHEEKDNYREQLCRRRIISNSLGTLLKLYGIHITSYMDVARRTKISHIAPHTYGLFFTNMGAAVSERTGYSPPTKPNRVQSPAGPLPDFCKQESCRTMPLVGRFPWGSPVFPSLHSGAAPFPLQFHPHRL